MEDELKNLEHLLESIDDIEERLKPWLTDTNIFKILKISSQEIRHSNFLAYLFNPSASHKINDTFLKEFLNHFYKLNRYLVQEHTNLSIFDIFLGDFNDAIVYRELNNIDLLIVSETNKLTLCIENKIFASESDHQLTKYREFVLKNYPDYQNLFIFLDPHGIGPTKDEWGSITYDTIVDILRKILNKSELDDKVYLLISDYVSMLKGDILMDDKLKMICQRIYLEHQEALDLIFEAKPDAYSVLRSYLTEALGELSEDDKIVFDERNSNKRLLRFQLEGLNKIFPEFPSDLVSGWNDQKSYYVEIEVKENAAYIHVAFNSANSDEVREAVASKLSVINETRSGRNASTWTWWVVGRKRIQLIKEDYVNHLISIRSDQEEQTAITEIKESIENEIKRLKVKFTPLSSDK